MVHFLSSLLFVIDVIVAILLIAIIMIQQSKSGGGIGAISGGGGGGMGESVLGPAAGNIITRTTVILASLFLGCTLFLAILSQYQSEDVSIAEKLEKQEQAAEAEKAVGEATERATTENEGEQSGNLSGSDSESTAGEEPNTNASSATTEDDSSAENR